MTVPRFTLIALLTLIFVGCSSETPAPITPVVVVPTVEVPTPNIEATVQPEIAGALTKLDNPTSGFIVRNSGSSRRPTPTLTSTMPSNKWGEWQMYMEAYQAGLIDKVEALKKTEIFDKEGVFK